LPKVAATLLKNALFSVLKHMWHAKTPLFQVPNCGNFGKKRQTRSEPGAPCFCKSLIYKKIAKSAFLYMHAKASGAAILLGRMVYNSFQCFRKKRGQGTRQLTPQIVSGICTDSPLRERPPDEQLSQE
jgi:hypothetical protein